VLDDRDPCQGTGTAAEHLVLDAPGTQVRQHRLDPVHRTITRPARPATSVSVTSVPSRTITTRSTTCDLELADRRAAGLGGDMSAKVVDREVVEAILGGEDDRDRLAGWTSISSGSKANDRPATGTWRASSATRLETS
jgi:hypothetical protein